MTDQVHESPAVAAIAFALTIDEGVPFLECWLQGDFDVIRRDWPECPQAAFDGAEGVTPEPWGS